MDRIFAKAGFQEVRPDTFYSLGFPGIRVKVRPRGVDVFHRRQSRKRRNGVWERVAQFEKPRDSRGWRKILRAILKDVLPSAPGPIPEGWNGENRRSLVASQGRGRHGRSLPSRRSVGW